MRLIILSCTICPVIGYSTSTRVYVNKLRRHTKTIITLHTTVLYQGYHTQLRNKAFLRWLEWIPRSYGQTSEVHAVRVLHMLFFLQPCPHGRQQCISRGSVIHVTSNARLVSFPCSMFCLASRWYGSIVYSFYSNDTSQRSYYDQQDHVYTVYPLSSDVNDMATA